MRTVEFVENAFSEFRQWIIDDRKIAIRIAELIADTQRTPFSGLGKPEPLKHQFRGKWSRRITDEHRLVYQVTESSIVIFSCRSHY